MSTDTFKFRLPFNPRYGWHKSKKQPCANYGVYNAAGKRKLRTKYFSRGHELHSSESLAEFDQWRKRMIDGLRPTPVTLSWNIPSRSSADHGSTIAVKPVRTTATISVWSPC